MRPDPSNFGDCFASPGTFPVFREPLWFKGDDFSQ